MDSWPSHSIKSGVVNQGHGLVRMGADRRLVNVNKPGMRAFHQRRWAGQAVDVLNPVGGANGLSKLRHQSPTIIVWFEHLERFAIALSRRPPLS